MEAVEEAVFKDFKRWGKENGNSNKEVGDFMEEMYAMKIGKGDIFDKIKAITLPPIRNMNTSSLTLLENLAACKESKREKRETLPQDCVLDEGKNYRPPTGGKLDLIFYPYTNDSRQAGNWQECAEFCFQYTKEPCGFWSYATGGKTCYLKAPDFYEPRYKHLSRNVKETRANWVSGNVACGLGEFLVKMHK